MKILRNAACSLFVALKYFPYFIFDLLGCPHNFHDPMTPSFLIKIEPPFHIKTETTRNGNFCIQALFPEKGVAQSRFSSLPSRDVSLPSFDLHSLCLPFAISFISSTFAYIDSQTVFYPFYSGRYLAVFPRLSSIHLSIIPLLGCFLFFINFLFDFSTLPIRTSATFAARNAFCSCYFTLSL